MLSHHLCRPQRHCSVPLIPASPTFGHTQGSFCIVAPPPEVHKRRRQIVGGLPFEGNTALLLSHFVVFSIDCSDSTYAERHLLTDNFSSVAESDWMSVPTSLKGNRHYVPQPILLCGSGVEGFDQNCLRQGCRQEHRDGSHHESMA